MKKFRLSPEAAWDIRDIWAYIAKDNVKAARKVRLSILDACRLLAGNPRIGHPQPDWTDQPVHFWPVGTYLIVFRPETEPLNIVRVLHGSRDIPRLI